jgi:hypothetical protein
MSKRETVKTDGERRIIVRDARYPEEGFDVSVCLNGYQSTIVSMDKEMLLWLKEAITEHVDALTTR